MLFKYSSGTKLTILILSLVLLNFVINEEFNKYEDLIKQYMQQNKVQEPEQKVERQTVAPKVIGRFYCDHSVNLNTVRQDVMRSNNFNKIMYRYKYFLLYVTATWCDYCCQLEKELLGVKQMLMDKTIEGEEIPIVQIHSDTDLDALKELKIGFFKVPSLYFVKEKQFIQYNSFIKAYNIFRFINNIVNPVVELHSVEDVENFFDTTKNFPEKNDFLGNTEMTIQDETDHHLRIRMIAFFSDLEEYSAEYSQFLSLAEKISNRPDLRIGIIIDKEIVRHFKQIYEGIWFNSHSWNSIVLKRVTKYYFLDLSLLNEQLETFMVYNSIPFLDELSNNNNFITSKIATPIALFFIDTCFIKENFHEQLKFLIDISKHYVGKYIFMYMDGNSKSKSKESLGLKKELKIPVLVINYIQSGKQKQLPQDLPYNNNSIHKFLDDNYFGKLVGTDFDDLREKNIKSYSDKIVINLKQATKIEKKNFEKIISNKKYDIIVFTVDTDYDKISDHLAKYINKICERFRSLGIKSVLFAYYDINENGLFHYQGINYKSGDILFSPSSSKKIITYDEKLTLLRLMKWVERNSEIKIRLPDIPHIELEMQEEYYKRKSILESYDENMTKSDIEIDDLLNMDFESLPTDENPKKTEF